MYTHTHSLEAGPEWEYCARVVDQNKKDGVEVDFDDMFINIQREGDEPRVIIDVLQALQHDNQQGTYMPSSVMRFSFKKLQDLVGPDARNFDLFFEAFDGAGSEVAIPDSQSFRRLLVAISGLGLPTHSKVSKSTDFPHVLRFLARPNTSPEEGTLAIKEPPRQKGMRTRPPPEAMNPVGTPTSSRSVAIAKEVGKGDTRTSFLLDPEKIKDAEESEEAERELTFKERVDDHDTGYGFGGSDDVHQMEIHKLYSNIAGISPDMIDPENNDHKYRPPYSNIHLPPHQRYPTAWLLHDSRKVFHMLADTMGVGKTFAAIEAMVRITIILSNNIAIQNERKQLSSLAQRPLHVHYGTKSHWGINRRCRANTEEKFGIVCPCTEDSALHGINERADFEEGFMMVIVPLNITNQWHKEISRFIRSTFRLPHNDRRFEVIDIHDAKGSPGEELVKFIYSQREHKGLGTIVIVPMSTTIRSVLEKLGKEKQDSLKQQPSLIFIDEMQRIKSDDHESILFVNRLTRLAYGPVHTVALTGTPLTTGPSDLNIPQAIALGNAASFRDWFNTPGGNDMYARYEDRLLKARENLNKHAKMIRDADIVGLGKAGQIPDEKIAEAHASLKLYDQACREYAKLLPMLQRRPGGNFLGYRIPRSLANFEPVQYLDCTSPMDETQRNAAAGYKEYLRQLYRGKVRTWRTKPEATRGPKPKMKDMIFTLDANPQPVSNASSRATVGSITETSLIGFAPGLALAVLRRKIASDQFRSPEANRFFQGSTITTQRRAVMNTPFWEGAGSSFRKRDEQTGQMVLHPKIRFICEKINEMLRDTEAHKEGDTSYGVFPKKMVICVPHAWHGFILTTFLFKIYPHRTFTFLGSGSTPAERRSLIAPFIRNPTVRAPEDGRSDDPIVLISTFDLMGEGLNLIRCNYAIAASPLATASRLDQFFGRINRQGQLCTTHSYVLYDNGNPVDVTTYYRMRTRTALTMRGEDMPSGLNFLLEDIQEIEEEEVEGTVETEARDPEAEQVE